MKKAVKKCILIFLVLINFSSDLSAIAPESGLRPATDSSIGPNLLMGMLERANRRRPSVASGKANSYVELLSDVKRFNLWNGIGAVGKGKMFLFNAKPMSFFSEDPDETVMGLKKYLKTGRLFPSRVEMDISNICNNDCVMCFSKEVQRKSPCVIPTERVLRIIEDLAQLGIRHIRFTGGGEPLTHPGFKKFVQRAYELDLEITVETNGDGLDNELIDFLCRRVRHFRISVDSSSNDTRKEVHRPKNPEWTFDRLKENVKKVVDKRRELKREDSMLIGATFVILPYNYNEVESFVRGMKAIGIDWVGVRMLTTDRTIYKTHPEIMLEALKQLDRVRTEESLSFKVCGPYGVTQTPQRDFKHCLVPTFRYAILADSTGQLCCLARSNSISPKEVNMGAIGNEENPIQALFERGRGKIDDFMRRAPSFCGKCIDLDLNIMLERITEILEKNQESEFKKVKCVPFGGDRIYRLKTPAERDIDIVLLPVKYMEQYNQGKMVNTEGIEICEIDIDKDTYYALVSPQFSGLPPQIEGMLRDISVPAAAETIIKSA